MGVAVFWLELSDCWMKLKLELKVSPWGVTLDSTRQGWRGEFGLNLSSPCGLEDCPGWLDVHWTTLQSTGGRGEGRDERKLRDARLSGCCGFNKAALTAGGRISFRVLGGSVMSMRSSVAGHPDSPFLLPVVFPSSSSPSSSSPGVMLCSLDSSPLMYPGLRWSLLRPEPPAVPDARPPSITSQ